MLPTLLIALCVVLRIVPHPPNFAPVGAMAVFAGRTLKPGAAFGLVIVAMFLGDVVLGRLHGYPVVSRVTPFIYGGFLLQAWLGRRLRSRTVGAIGAALVGSLGFFVLSNFGVWVAGALYPHTAAGLMDCYVEAIPFFGATVVGDAVWTMVLNALYRPAGARLEPRSLWVPVPTKELGIV